MKSRVICGVAAFVVALLAPASCAQEVVPIRSVAVENHVGGKEPEEASRELALHLSCVSGKPFVAATENPALTIVLGEKAPGEGDPEAFTSYGKRVGGRIYLWGDDSEDRPGTLFAVYGFLESVLGVVWPMPGDDNIVAPAADSLRVPMDWSRRYRPPLLCGMMCGGSVRRPVKDRTPEFAPNPLRRTEAQIVADAQDIARWKLRQKMFVRERMPFGHAFMGWNVKYRDTHPEYLALQENGKRGSSAGPTERGSRHMKLCVSNEAVVDQIVQNYIDAGRPKYYNICPNDSRMFCRCEKCKALDCPQNDGERTMQTLLPGSMTDRYVNFWNRIAKKLVAIRPDVMIDTYAYCNYRDAPRRERIAYPDNMCFGMVPSAEDDNLAQIRAWKAKGMKHFKLRPNYLCYRGWLMRGLERFYLENFKMNFREGMIGTDYDGSPRGEVTAFECYAIARAMQDPEVSFEMVEREFLSRYGKAAPKMKEYYDRVRDRNEKALFAKQKMKARDKESVLDDSELVKTVAAANSREVLLGDIKLIDEALKTPGLTPVELKRVRVMRVLAEHAVLTSDFLAAYDDASGTVAPDFTEKGLKLLEFRINEVAPVIAPFNWGITFRGYPAEVKYWRQNPLRKILRKKYPEMGYAD